MNMKKILFILILIFINYGIIYGQSSINDANISKINAQANVLAKRFCDCIVRVGTTNGISYKQKKRIISDAGKDFYNYYEDPRIMTTTTSTGKENRKPIHTYLNNLLIQSNTQSIKRRKYEIRYDRIELNGRPEEWTFLKNLNDGCELYYRTACFYQTYRVIDILNKNPELRNTEHIEKEKKYITIYAIIKPRAINTEVRLGDIYRSDCLDSRKK